MFKIAIVEDEQNYVEILTAYLEQFKKERNLSFVVHTYTNAVYFLDGYRPDFDIVFMDIQMPYLNGMEAARKLREMDQQVLLIFITRLSHYAVQGYEVGAFDYIVKPIAYMDFSLKMFRAVRRIGTPKNEKQVVIDAKEGIIRMPADEIRYIEVLDHQLTYHTGRQGTTVYTRYATLSSILPDMQSYDFARCNNCYLVNLNHVQRINGFTVTVDGVDLQISQTRKREFVKTYREFAIEKYK